MTMAWTVHVVDDDAAVRTALLFALEVKGFRVADYVDAADFLARGRGQRGVLICDVRMPGMDGIELTRLLTQEAAAMPIILITGHANQALKAEAIAAGALSVLEKPVDLAVLLAEITGATAGWE
ncbi:response regulator [Sphingomonas sp. AR_OL41]|uniref:response regulator transcription factor n=1 Tax=Sphingomonas sp. AR_OL41 TaxID=3042729 RepID=UPI002480F1D7|nr:response regulator [Sphingomonas sp. AR_OL41]MDH7974287.1 response regulator [Sphingomonas sp. AR_OL41]